MRSRVFLRHSVLFATLAGCLLGCASHEIHHHHKASASAPPPPPPPPPQPAPAPEPAPATPAPAPTASSAPIPVPVPVPMPASIVGPPPPPKHNATPSASPPAALRPAPQPSAYPLNDAIAAWQNQLKSGNIDYSVPSPMTTKQATRVSVTIHGFADTNTQPDADVSAPTGHDVLKVSDQMEVKLSYDPKEFTVDAQGDPPIKVVPQAGSADWIWYVTPINPVASQVLILQVYLIYPGANGNIETRIDEKDYPVTVNVQKLATTIDQSFWSNPMAFIEYMSPGGKGAAAIVALCSFFGLGAWLKKKFAPKSNTPPST